MFDAPLGAPANPGMSTNPAKSPWYFVGFQELQLHFHPLVAVVVIPFLAALALFAIPYLRYPEAVDGPVVSLRHRPPHRSAGRLLLPWWSRRC